MRHHVFSEFFGREKWVIVSEAALRSRKNGARRRAT